MKCPKCSYLGFETGDRCRNCGYDFSLLTPTPASAAEIPLRPSASSTDVVRLDEFDLPLIAHKTAEVPDTDIDAALFDHRATAMPATRRPDVEPLPAAAAAVPLAPADDIVRASRLSARVAPALPLFSKGADEDAPLISVPASPRAPLAVRRTPEAPRLRAVAKAAPRREPAPVEPVLFSDADAVDDVAAKHVAGLDAAAPAAPDRRGDQPSQSRVWRDSISTARPSGPARRIGALLIDHLILTSIDLAVVYFTLRILAMDAGAWAQLPPIPLAAFLVLIKLAYFSAFTAIGGQTIGKMAARIRVVTDELTEVSGGQAVGRAMFGALSTLTFGLGFVPGLFGDGRSLHDRAARTRVVRLEPA